MILEISMQVTCTNLLP